MYLKQVGVLLALAQCIAGHARIQDAWGDVDTSVHGPALGVLPGTPLRNQVRYVGLADVAVFSNPTIQNDACKACPSYQATCAKCKKCSVNKKTKKKKCWWIKNCKACPKYNPNCAKCRTKLSTGCGRTFFVDPSSDLYTMDPKPAAPKKCCGYNGAKKNWANYGKGALNTQKWLSKAATANQIPIVRPKGYLFMNIYQINTDGAGPYTCTIDQSATANSFSTTLTMISNVLGKEWKGKQTFANGLKFTNFTMVAVMPSDLNCQGKVGGKSNICIVRCMNGAPNGPFGGCIPVQQCQGSACGGTPVSPPVIPTPSETAPPPPADDDGYTDEQLEDQSTDEPLDDDQIAAMQGYGYTD